MKSSCNMGWRCCACEFVATMKHYIVSYGRTMCAILKFIVVHFGFIVLYAGVAAGAFLAVATCHALLRRLSSCYATVCQQMGNSLLLQCAMAIILVLAITWMASSIIQAIKRLRASHPYKCLLVGESQGMDAPITQASEDRLDRLPFVDAIIHAIKESCRQPQAAFIALYGAWGEGKTSVVNILDDRLRSFEQNLFLVRFAPWGSRAKEGYAAELCDTLASTVVNLGLPGGAMDLRLLGAKLSSSSLWEALTAQSGCINFLNSCVRAFSGMAALESRVREMLCMLPENQRLVVVIDDVDRLMHKEIIELIRLIRTNCDFPRVTYLVLADQQHVEMALGREIVGDCKDNQIDTGHEYLEKIFPVAFKLPQLPKERLPNLLMGLISKMLKDRRLAALDENSCAAKMIPLLVKTMRHVRQCAAYVGTQLYYLYTNPQNHSRPCICEDDFISLTLLGYFYPDTYETLYREKDELLAGGKRQEEELLALFSCERDKFKKKAVWLFLTHVLHFKPSYRQDSNSSMQEFWSVTYKSVEAVRDYRMIVPSCYDNYFTGYTERSVAIPKAQVEEFVQMVASEPRGPRLEELIQKFYGNGYLRPLFYALQSDMDLLQNSKVSLSNVFLTFAKIAAARLGDKISDIENPVTYLNLERALFADLLECLVTLTWKYYPDQHERGLFLYRMFADQDCDDGLLLLQVLLLEKEDGGHHRPMVPHREDDGMHLICNDADYDRLLTVFARQVQKMPLDAHPNETLLREKWLWLSKVCKWNEKIYGSYNACGEAVMRKSQDSVLHWMLPFLENLRDEDYPWVVDVNYHELKSMQCFDDVVKYFEKHGFLLPPAWELVGKYLLRARDKIGSENRRYTMREYLHDNECKTDVERIVYRYKHKALL